MGRCTFCGRAAEQRLWLRRWPVQNGRRRQSGAEEVRVALCAEHLQAAVFERQLLLKEGWAYG